MGTLAILALVVALWPAQWGGFLSLTIVSGASMEPTYASGDLVVGLRRQPALGDVVVYRPDGVEGHVVHRVVGGSPDGWTTRGDGNTWDDIWTADADNTLGVVQWRVPGASRYLPSGPLLPVAIACLIGAVLLWPGRDETTVTTSADYAEDAAEYHI
ncbi:S24/S26 family peptidase [Xylanimonas cellulosilytica]|uniref:S24/S26 family peptidase n=1 Tax=Xylanimonas cellulosilytica TaxID=186189 RepID=UPI00019C03B0|nr:S24/S26 family peptidase [Xylanimonas cellulosilytica]